MSGADTRSGTCRGGDQNHSRHLLAVRESESFVSCTRSHDAYHAQTHVLDDALQHLGEQKLTHGFAGDVNISATPSLQNHLGNLQYITMHDEIVGIRSARFI